MIRRVAALTGAVAAAVALAAGMTPAFAAPEASESTVLKALQRDLKISAKEARTRLANERKARAIGKKLRAKLGDSFGGAWLNEDASVFTVATTDASRFDGIQKAGATAKVVERSEKELKAVKARLDRRKAPEGATSWAIDVQRNQVVVRAKDRVKAVKRFAVKVGKYAAAAGADAVSVVRTGERPRLFADVVGGDAYYPGSSRCSVGFSVEGGFATAGHCGSEGTPTNGVDQSPQGTVAGSVFPGQDIGHVEVNDNWTPTPQINDYEGGTIGVAGHEESEVGASVCRSGSTTGPRGGIFCGTLQAKGETVRYPQGTVRDLTRTTVCAEPGDSGGSFFSDESPAQAQGVTSGGSGNCSSGGTTFFQPLNPILDAFSLTLVTE